MRQSCEINILIACEESQRICNAFCDRGFNAFSCDLQLCSGGHPERHINSDVIPLLNGNCSFVTQDGSNHLFPYNWDLIVAHPPCTYMSKAGATSMYPIPGVIDEERFKKAMYAKEFFMVFYNCSCKHVVIENPRPLKIIGLPKCSQIIQPYQFGEAFSKLTMLWLKGLPFLYPTNYLTNHISYTATVHSSVDRSKTFSGIASAIADVYGDYLLSLSDDTDIVSTWCHDEFFIPWCGAYDSFQLSFDDLI